MKKCKNSSSNQNKNIHQVQNCSLGKVTWGKIKFRCKHRRSTVYDLYCFPKLEIHTACFYLLQQTIFNKLQPYVQIQCSLFLLQVWLDLCCKNFLLQIVFFPQWLISTRLSSLRIYPNTSQKPQVDVFLTSESVLWTFTLLRVCQLLKGPTWSLFTR